MIQKPLLDYQRQVSEITRLQSIYEEQEWGDKAAALYRAGWDYQVRLGQCIWKKEDPEAPGGFRGWYGEEVAYEMLERGVPVRVSVEAGRHLVLLAEEEVRVDEVSAQNRSAISRAEELLVLVVDEVLVHEVLAELEHELEELLSPAPPGLPIRFLPPLCHDLGIRQRVANEQDQTHRGEEE